jgi:hypothetical protein
MRTVRHATTEIRGSFSSHTSKGIILPAADCRVADMSTVPPPSRNVRIAAYASALSAVIGSIPLHLVWALGIPLFADEERFRTWYDGSTAAYLHTLNALALLPAVLAVALVRPWGLTFPRWVPLGAGRRVPRLLLIIPGYAVSVLLALYATYAAVLAVVLFDEPEAIFSPWTVVYGVPQFTVWALGLILATRSYAARTGRTHQRD